MRVVIAAGTLRDADGQVLRADVRTTLPGVLRAVVAVDAQVVGLAGLCAQPVERIHDQDHGLSGMRQGPAGTPRRTAPLPQAPRTGS